MKLSPIILALFVLLNAESPAQTDGAQPPDAVTTPAGKTLTDVPALAPATSQFENAFVGRLAPYEPIYFIYGPHSPAAKFQFSIKYKILRFGVATPQYLPSTLQFGFTQRSLWDINASSSPFYDTSYMPELFFESLAPISIGPGGWFTWLGYQVGFKHESNGREGPVSRSLNTVYARPVLALGPSDGWRLVVSPVFFTYVGGLTDNRDLIDYRGYGQLRLVFGKNTGPSLMYTGSAGKHWDRYTTQLDLTVPVRTRLLDFKTFLLLQYFNGYGESLLSYSAKTETIRAGVAIVR